MSPQQRKKLLVRWNEVDRELCRVAGGSAIPRGDADPISRLLAELDAVEHALDDDALW